MPVTLTPITLPQLTEATTTGSGVFDVLMKATKAHLEQEFTQGRIKGAEYATVYLGSLEAVMQNALQFLLQKDKVALDAELVRQQVLLAEAEPYFNLRFQFFCNDFSFLQSEFCGFFIRFYQS